MIDLTNNNPQDLLVNLEHHASNLDEEKAIIY